MKKWTQDYKQFLESMTVGASDEKGAFVKARLYIYIYIHITKDRMDSIDPAG